MRPLEGREERVVLSGHLESHGAVWVSLEVVFGLSRGSLRDIWCVIGNHLECVSGWEIISVWFG